MLLQFIGFEQELTFEQRNKQVIISGLVVRDYPLVLRIERQENLRH